MLLPFHNYNRVIFINKWGSLNDYHKVNRGGNHMNFESKTLFQIVNSHTQKNVKIQNCNRKVSYTYSHII